MAGLSKNNTRARILLYGTIWNNETIFMPRFTFVINDRKFANSFWQNFVSASFIHNFIYNYTDDTAVYNITLLLFSFKSYECFESYELFTYSDARSLWSNRQSSKHIVVIIIIFQMLLIILRTIRTVVNVLKVIRSLEFLWRYVLTSKP